MENMNYKFTPADINKATIRDLSVTNQAEELKIGPVNFFEVQGPCRSVCVTQSAGMLWNKHKRLVNFVQSENRNLSMASQSIFSRTFGRKYLTAEVSSCLVFKAPDPSNLALLNIVNKLLCYFKAISDTAYDEETFFPCALHVHWLEWIV